MADWYRKTTWTEADEAEFFKRLARASEYNRPQYLRVQAITFVETKDRELLKTAENLLNKLLADYPDNLSEKGNAFDTLGDIYKEREEYDTAIGYYKKALDLEAIYPQHTTTAYLDYCYLVVRKGHTDLYDEVENILTKRLQRIGMIFPIEVYKVHSLLSIIYRYKNNVEKAEYHAQMAEAGANVQTSGLSYHKSLGVVVQRDAWLDKLVCNK